MTAQLPEYLPLDEAARRYHLDRAALTRLIDSGRIRAARVNGGVAVAEEDMETITKCEHLWQQVAHLDGQPISMNRARSEYGIGAATLYDWIEQGIIRVIKRAPNQITLNRADVAYANLVARERSVRRGRRTFTPEYLPPHLRQ